MGDKMLSLYEKKTNEYVTQNICINSDESTDLCLAAALYLCLIRESNKESTSLYSISQNM